MNPYETPQFGPAGAAEGMPPTFLGPGLVNHVRIVAILMMVQAGLEVLMGLFLLVMAVVVPFFIEQAARQDPNFQQGEVPPEMFRWIMLATYGGMGAVNLVAGGLHGYAGYCNFRLKGRTLGIVALAGGLVTVLGCYCMPTALALAVYGFIVYSNGSVIAAFSMAEQGYKANDVIAALNQQGGLPPQAG